MKTLRIRQANSPGETELLKFLEQAFVPVEEEGVREFRGCAFGNCWFVFEVA